MKQSSIVNQLLDVLAAHGVSHIYGVPGDAINDLMEALRQRDDITFIQVRHEESGAFAAAAYAKLTGKLGVCAGTSGGGAIHLLNGLYDAKLDHAPVLAITGQLPRAELGSTAHQEIDSVALYQDVSVFNQMLVSAQQAPELFVQACRSALLNKGVSHIALPGDVATQSVDKPLVNIPKLSQTAPSNQDAALIEEACHVLKEAKKPLILAGVGALSAREKLLEFAEHWGAPIVRSLKAKTLIADDHPMSLGGLGLLGTKPAAEAMERCDTLLMVGTDFPYSDYLPIDARVLQIDSAALHIGRRCPVEYGLVGDAKLLLEQLLAQTSANKQRNWLEEYQQKAKDWQSKQEEDETLPEQGEIKPQALARAVGAHAPEDAVFLCDTGAVTAWVARHLPTNHKQSFTLSGNLATMAFAMSGGIGAQHAFPDRQVIALCGDGGFAMLMQDFLTLVKYELPVTVIVFNNAKLQLIQLEQETRGYPEHKTDLHNPDYAAFAKNCGGLGFSVKDSSELPAALDKAFGSKQPCVIDVAIKPDELIMPPKINLSQAWHFSLAKVREFIADQI